MLEKIRTYLRGNQRGDVFFMAAASRALMFCGAVVVDLGSVYAHKSEMQNAADAAALAGARAFANHEEIADNAKNAGSGQNHPHAGSGSGKVSSSSKISLIGSPEGVSWE